MIATNTRRASLIAVAIGMALLVVSAWLLFGRFMFAQYQQNQLVGPASSSSLSSVAPHGSQSSSLALVRDPKPGEYFGVLKIPRLGESWAKGISEGTSPSNLDRYGVGHYAKTPFPDQEGNFALAGHSGNRWMPFEYLDSVKINDQIYVETLDARYEYVVRETKIVDPYAVEVVRKLPKSKGSTGVLHWVTLTTCIGSEEEDLRLIVHGELVAKVAV
jgi:sortase A